MRLVSITGIDGDAGKDVVCIDDKCPRANSGGEVIGGYAVCVCVCVCEREREPTGGYIYNLFLTRFPKLSRVLKTKFLMRRRSLLSFYAVLWFP